MRDGKVFEHVAATIEADEGKQVLAAYFLRRDPALVLVNSDGALDRVDLAGAPGVKAHLPEPAAGRTAPANGAPSPSPARRIEKWAFNPEQGRLLVSSLIPPDYTAIAASTSAVKRWVSVADATGGEGRVWLSDVALDSSALSDVVLGQNGRRYALVNQDGMQAGLA